MHIEFFVSIVASRAIWDRKNSIGLSETDWSHIGVLNFPIYEVPCLQKPVAGHMN